MNAVAMATQLFVTNSATGALVEKTAMPTMAFSQILGGLTMAIPQKTENEEIPVEETLTSVLSMLENGATEEEIAQALSGMSKEETDNLLKIIEQILAEISETIKNSSNEVPQEKQDDVQDNTTTIIPKEIVNQILAEMGVNTQTQFDMGGQQKFTNISINIETLAISDTTPQNLSKISEMLNTLKNALNSNSQMLQGEKFTVIKNDFATPVQKSDVAQTQDFTAQKAEVKPVEKNAEFSEILAFTQQTKAPTTAQTPQQPQVIIPVEKQIIPQLEQMLTTNMTDGTKELTIMLKPAELGQVGIKLSQTEAGLTVSIMAVNSETQKLITEQLPNLVSSLQTMNSEVKSVVIVNANENASSFLGEFNLSQSGSQNQQNNQQSQSSYFVDGKAEQNEKQDILIREEKLWQTA